MIPRQSKTLRYISSVFACRFWSKKQVGFGLHPHAWMHTQKVRKSRMVHTVRTHKHTHTAVHIVFQSTRLLSGIVHFNCYVSAVPLRFASKSCGLSTMVAMVYKNVDKIICEKHGKAIFTINLLMVSNAWCPNEDVKLDASKDWLVMCLPNLLLEHFFLLEKDWLTLLEIRLLLKRCEAATFTLASKV